MRPILILATDDDVGHNGRTAYVSIPGGEAAVRGAIRTALAGEVARVGATRLEDFESGADHDIQLAMKLADGFGLKRDAVVQLELAVTVEQVAEYQSEIAALTRRLLDLPINPLGHIALGAQDAARLVGFEGVRDERGQIVAFRKVTDADRDGPSSATHANPDTID
jgi:hypothetical protein